MKILFVCKHNRFRSKIAEAYFNKINENRGIQVYSAGVLIGTLIAKSVKQVARKLGFSVKGKPKGIKDKLLKEIDLLVIVADDVPEELFKKKVEKIFVWNIPDVEQSNLDKIEEISRKIMERVDELNVILKGK